MLNQVQNNIGQNEPGTNYPIKTEIEALVMDAKAVEYSKSNGKPGQSLYLKDNDGDIAWVKLTGQFEPLSKGTKAIFKVWPYKPPQSPKTYLYCWVQNAPQPTPQASYNVPQSTNGDMLTKIYNVLQAILEVLNLMSLPEGQRMAKQFEKEQNLNEPIDEPVPDDNDIPY